jgi:hypothetical protein
MRLATQAFDCGQLATQVATVSKIRLWVGRVISAVVVLFLIFDGVAKVVREPHVLEGSARLGYPVSVIVWIGIVLLASSVVYVIPRTSILGAILLNGYLGGATASQVRVGNPVFEALFPVIFGVLIWAGLFLREDRLRALLPLRS